ncbi:MAG: type II CAAX endopeptidase family protein [Paracoccaceae bacterium]
MFTPEFDAYVEPAKPHAQIWRLVLGFVVIVAVYLLFVVLIFATLYSVFGDQAGQFADETAEANTPTGMFILFASFAGAVFGTFLAVRVVHKRSPKTLFGPRARVLNDFAVSAAAVVALNAVFLLVLSIWVTPLPNLPFTLWLTLLPLTLIGLLIQTGAEELVFRGYLQQQLGARFRSPLIWMVLPSLLFASLHYSPETAGGNTWLIVGATGFFGLLAADLTRVTGSLGAAWGFHFANNLWAIVFLAVDGNVTGLALYVTPYSADDTDLLPQLIGVDLVSMVVIWFILRRVFHR